MTNCDAIVAGAGIWGCTVARRLAEAGKKVLVLEKRPVVGGNVRCEIDPETGIEIHTYGSHIFHTHIPEVWEFVNRFVTFNGYRHCVIAKTKMSGRSANGEFNSLFTYHLPIGKTLLEEFFGIDMREKNLKDFLARPSILDAKQTSRTNGEALFDAFIRGYTSKQWGVPPEKVDPSVIARLKVRDNYSTDYFDDPCQGIPVEGYNELFRKMLDHPNIVLRTSSSLKLKLKDVVPEFHIYDEIKNTSHPLFNFNSQLQLFYSGPIDALFNYKFGALPWRTLRFERETLHMPDYQGTSVVNYPDIDVPYTRIHEFKHYHPEGKGQGAGKESQRSEVRGQTKDVNLHSLGWGFDSPKTIIMREYSASWQPGDEPYYPIDTPDSRALLAKYQAEVEKLNTPSSTSTATLNLIIGGRLGGYKYYDMDKSIEAALKVGI